MIKDLMRKETIRGYVLSHKSYQQQEKEKIYTFWVNPRANKFQIKQFVEQFFQVKVKKVRTCREKPVLQKTSLLRRFPGKLYTKLRKKAFIQLAPGYQLGSVQGKSEN
jgi:large subunit ribosomal protein L23